VNSEKWKMQSEKWVSYLAGVWPMPAVSLIKKHFIINELLCQKPTPISPKFRMSPQKESGGVFMTKKM